MSKFALYIQDFTWTLFSSWRWFWFCFSKSRFGISLVCYALSLNSVNVGSNTYINVALFGVANIFSALVPQFMIDKPWIGRKRSTLFFMLFTGLVLLLMLAVPGGIFSFHLHHIHLQLPKCVNKISGYNHSIFNNGVCDLFWLVLLLPIKKINLLIPCYCISTHLVRFLPQYLFLDSSTIFC